MGRRQIHYERAFTAMLKERGVPYVAVDEARRAILPSLQPLKVKSQAPLKTLRQGELKTLKAFDYVLYGTPNLLVELKGRRLAAGSKRLENWVTDDDVDSLRRWRALFSRGGPNYTACFVFVYECDHEPPQTHNPLFPEDGGDCWIYKDRWYALRTVDVEAYAAHMKVRSARWRTVNLAKEDFDRLSGPLLAREPA